MCLITVAEEASYKLQVIIFGLASLKSAILKLKSL